MKPFKKYITENPDDFDIAQTIRDFIENSSKIMIRIADARNPVINFGQSIESSSKVQVTGAKNFVSIVSGTVMFEFRPATPKIRNDVMEIGAGNTIVVLKKV